MLSLEQNEKGTEKLSKRDEIFQSLKVQLRLNNELMETNNALQSFFSIISHDLRSPFNAILGFIDILSNSIDDLSEKQIRMYVECIKKSAYQNYYLTEKLLSWAAINKKGIKVHRERHTIKSIVDKVLSNHIALSNKKGIKVKNHISQCLMANIDTNIVETVLCNLINNAIKYTRDKGMIEIFGKKENHRICLTVKDNGIGMSKNKITNLFKIGEVRSTPGTNDEPGSGLGLILCKELLKYHNGYLQVESIQGKGTSFSVLLLDK